MVLNSLTKERLSVAAHLIYCQVDASVGDDAQHVGNVALIKGAQSFPPENLLGTVRDTRVLSGLPQSETSFQDLRMDSKKKMFNWKILSPKEDFLQPVQIHSRLIKLMITSMG